MSDESTTAATTRAASAVAGALLSLGVVAAAREGLWQFGVALHELMNSRGWVGLARPIAFLLGYALLASLAAFLAARGSTGRMPVVIGLLGAAALYAPRYLASIEPLSDFDFHGIPTNVPSQVWPEFSPVRKKIFYRINAHGLRGDDFIEAKKPGVVRIALVGDSFVFGMGVEESETLKAALEAKARAHGIADRVEVLNLGIPGSNLPTHIRMYEVARRHLAADIVVMGIFVWNDLATWDCQDEYLGRSRVGVYSVLSWLWGREPASIFTTRLFVQHNSERRSLAAFDELAPRLAAARAPLAESPPLLILEYDPQPQASARLRTLPAIHLVETPRDETFFLPNDGHPSALGNKAFATLLWPALSSLGLAGLGLGVSP